MEFILQLTLTHILIGVTGLAAYALASVVIDRRRTDVHRLIKPVSAAGPSTQYQETSLSSGERTLTLGTREASMGER